MKTSLKKYLVRISFDKNAIYAEEIKAGNKKEAYAKAKEKLAKRLFKMSNLANYDCIEMSY